MWQHFSPRLVPSAIAALTTASTRDMARSPRQGLARAQTTLAEALWATATLPDAIEPATTKSRALHLIDEAEAFYRTIGPGAAPRLTALAEWRRAHVP